MKKAESDMKWDTRCRQGLTYVIEESGPVIKNSFKMEKQMIVIVELRNQGRNSFEGIGFGPQSLSCIIQISLLLKCSCLLLDGMEMNLNKRVGVFILNVSEKMF